MRNGRKPVWSAPVSKNEMTRLALGYSKRKYRLFKIKYGDCTKLKCPVSSDRPVFRVALYGCASHCGTVLCTLPAVETIIVLRVVKMTLTHAQIRRAILPVDGENHPNSPNHLIHRSFSGKR